ncbi:MAG: hypothetical protein RIG62_16810 [Cyclobacteriaceae bacterium]
MKPVNELISDATNNMNLNILVFGPQVHTISDNERTKNLQFKRIQIREELEALGHFVRYAEDLVDPNLPSPQNNAVLQEIVIMAEFDLIINIVESPGSITEATLIATKANLSQKATLFMDESHLGGLPAQACQLAVQLGANFETFKYPQDIVQCHLLGSVKKRVEKTQFTKFFS